MTAKKTTTPSAMDFGVFNFEVSPSLITQALYVYQENTHRGMSKVKTRGEVDRTKKKVYKQKGTGNARHGSRSANVYVGGGVVFGPVGYKTPAIALNKKMKIRALAGILSVYQKEGRLVSADSSHASISTKEAVKMLPEGVDLKNVSLVHFHESNEFLKSVGNLKIKLLAANRLNAFTVASAAKVMVTPNAYAHLVEKLTPIMKEKVTK